MGGPPPLGAGSFLGMPQGRTEEGGGGRKGGCGKKNGGGGGAAGGAGREADATGGVVRARSEEALGVFYRPGGRMGWVGGADGSGSGQGALGVTPADPVDDNRLLSI